MSLRTCPKINLNIFHMKTLSRYSLLMVIPLMISCQGKKDQSQLKPVLASINLMRGDIALCGSEEGEFGKVDFSLSCAEKVRADFNLAAALLHSFEYTE